MIISDLDFKQILCMCQLSLTDNELLEFKNYIKSIDKFYSELTKICDESINPIFCTSNEELMLVDDMVEEPMLLKDVLTNAPCSNSNYIVIKFGLNNG